MMIIIGAILAVVIAAAAFMLFSSGSDAGYSKIDIIGEGTVGENGTLNVKLENGQNIALKDKNVTVTLKNSKGKVVFNKTAKTFVNGVANIKLTNVSPGEYEVNATFGGDENYTASSVSEKIKIVAGESNETADENVTDEVVDDTTTTSDDSSGQSYTSQSQSSSGSYRPSSSSSSSSSSVSSDNSVYYTDENGNQAEGYIDEDGNPVYDDF